MTKFGKPRLSNVVFDIETVINPVNLADVEKHMAEYKPPSNYKDPLVILKHREKALEKAAEDIAKERRYSLGGKRMISAALGLADPYEGVSNVQSWYGDDLKSIVEGIVGYLDGVGPYRLVGWNISRFDLPEFIKSLCITGIKLRNKPPSKWDVVDLCNFPFRGVSLKEAALAFGLEQSGYDGSNVAEFYANEDWEKISKYNEEDVILTAKIFLATESILTF